MKAWATLLAGVALAGCTSVPPMPRVEYRYVLLGPEGVPVVRVLTSAAQCPSLEVDGKPWPTTVRMPAQTVALRPSRADLPAPKASVFDVTTCEATLPVTATRASLHGEPLPLPKARPDRIVLIGDTGCTVNANYKVFQACDDPVLWPYRRVAESAAATRPDLVIHVGDFHYRESPCAEGNKGCAGSPWGYGFDAWQADFFDPSRALFAAAPWIVIRGNHESCNRAGQGWWRFLDPRPVDPRQTCNDPAQDDIGNYSEPYAVPLGRGGDTQWLVFDSSWTGVRPYTAADLQYRNYRPQFEVLFALGARTPKSFFLAHHPVLGFAANPRDPQNPFPGNGGLQSVLATIYPGVLFPPGIEALISGHNHLLEVVSFTTAHPPQFITGNGGDWLDQPFPVPFPPGKEPAPGAVVAQMISSSRFGFMTMDREGDGWSMRAWDADGKPIAACTLRARKASCAPIVDLPPKP